MPVRIAVLSDDRLLCDGVARILESDSMFDVMACGSLSKLEMEARLRPVDVLLVDSRIDDAIQIAGAGTIAPAALLIAAPDDPRWCGDALCAGVSGVLPKQAGSDTLISAVRAVADGSVWAPRRVMAECIRHLVSASVARRDGTATLDRHLSRREREIFRHAATGLGNKQIADQLSIGEATVKAHLTSIFQKLGVRGRAELAALYHRVVPHPSMVVLPKSNAEFAAGLKK